MKNAFLHERIGGEFRYDHDTANARRQGRHNKRLLSAVGVFDEDIILFAVALFLLFVAVFAFGILYSVIGYVCSVGIDDFLRPL